MARAATRDIAGCGTSVPVVRVEGGGEELEGLEVKAAGAVSDVDVAGLRRGCVGVDAVATGEAEFRPISVSRESKKDGELGRVDTSKNCSPSVMSLVCFMGE